MESAQRRIRQRLQQCLPDIRGGVCVGVRASICTRSKGYSQRASGWRGYSTNAARKCMLQCLCRRSRQYLRPAQRDFSMNRQARGYSTNAAQKFFFAFFRFEICTPSERGLAGRAQKPFRLKHCNRQMPSFRPPRRLATGYSKKTKNPPERPADFAKSGV